MALLSIAYFKSSVRRKYNFKPDLFSKSNFIRSLVAGNTLEFWEMGFFTNELERVFVITPLGVFFIGLSFYVSYFVFIYLFTLPLFLILRASDGRGKVIY